MIRLEMMHKNEKTMKSENNRKNNFDKVDLFKIILKRFLSILFIIYVSKILCKINQHLVK